MKPRGVFARNLLAPLAPLLASCLAGGAHSAVSPHGPLSPAVDLAGYAHVVYVDAASGEDVAGDGSPARPWASIPHALQMAGFATAEQRVAILVSAGRYSQPTFLMRSHVDLYGGFARPGGNRDVFAYPSVLDGEEARRIAFGADHARLDGFHLVNGRVRGKGAALFIDAASPTIANCVFRDNRTLIPRPWGPAYLHETAHDGGAVMVLNGASPRIENCYFLENLTECGRGGALAVDRRSSPRVAGSVFANNRAGLVDPMRSSDGGAVSWFDWSGGALGDCVVVANEALTRNDAGGVFIALWAAPVFSGNVVVGNSSGDDAGGLFIGGQEHRYDAPLDPYPAAGQFNVIVANNRFVGNANSTRNSGAMRITMESRVHFAGNVIAENAGGMYFQRSEIIAERNTVWQDWRLVDDKPSLGPSRFFGNILRGPVAAVEARVTFERNMVEPGLAGSDGIVVADVFLEDGVDGQLRGARFDPVSLTTVLTTVDPLPAGDFAGRAVAIGSTRGAGQWRVIRAASGNTIELWGRLEAATGGHGRFEILRTFTLRPDAPAGLGAGAR